MKYEKQFLIALLILIVLVVTKPYTFGANDNSRMATIESLVNRQTFVIDKSPYDTVDKIFNGDNFYSTKPPLLSVTGAGIFWILKNIFRLSLSGPDTPSLAQYLITLIISGGSFITLLITFYKSLQWFKLKEDTKYIITALLGFSTYIFSYVGTLNNHIPTAAFAFLSFYYLLKIKFTQKQINTNLFYCGLFIGLAGVMDLASTALLWIVFYFLYFLKTIKPNKKILLYFIGGCAIPIILHFIFNYQITGDLFPAYMHKDWYHYPGSFWNQPSVKPNKLSYLFNLTFGHNGIFLYSPILLISLNELIKKIKNKTHNFYNESLLILTIIIASVTLVTFFTHDYAGNAYGMRWFIAFIPLLFFFNVFYFLGKKPSYVFKTIAIYSIFVALLGIIDPWSTGVTVVWAYNEYSMKFPLLSNLLKLTGWYH